MSEYAAQMELRDFVVPIVKVDAKRRLIYGIGTIQRPDKVMEELDWETSVPEIQKWSQGIEKMSSGKSKFNVRAMHPRTRNFDSVGVGVRLDFDHKRKAVPMVIEVIDDWAWEKVEKGAYNGLSMGGYALRKWPRPDNPMITRYTLRPTEVSLVDSPMIPECGGLVIVKADGSWDYYEINKQDGGNMSDQNTPATPAAPAVDVKALAADTATQVAERVEKMFGAKVQDHEDRVEKMERSIETLTDAVNKLLTAVAPPKATQTAVAKSDDSRLETDKSVATPPATTKAPEHFVGDGSGYVPEEVNKADIAAGIEEALGKPEVPYFLRPAPAK